MNLIFIIIFGMIFGSFLNMLIYRVPLKEKIVFPPSKCIYCKTVLKPWNLIPIFSYLLQGGRCSTCHKKIPIRYLLVELINVCCYIIGYIHFGMSTNFYVFCFLSSMLIMITFIDLDYMIIPDKLNLILFVTGLIYYFVQRPFSFKSLLLSMLIGSVFLFVLAVFTGGFGGGDIKYMFVMSFFLGFRGILVNMFIGFVLGSIVGIILIYTKRKSRKDMIPFGPYLCFGSLVAFMFANEIVQMYLYRIGYL